MQINETEKMSPEIKPYVNEQLFMINDQRAYNGGRKVFTINIRGDLNSHIQRMNTI